MPPTIEPALSVLVATRNRAALLGRLLQSLEAARAFADIANEIIVIDNGSTDETPAVLASWKTAAAGRITLRIERPGKSRALNQALPLARAPLLAFLDDDEQVGRAWFREVAAFFVAHPEYHAGVGRVLAPPDVTDPDILNRLACYRTIALFDHGDAARDLPLLHGANMALRREVFDVAGTFDERLGPGMVGGCEDQDLGERVCRAGFRIGYIPNAIVYHTIDPARLTPEYFRGFELRTARSRFAMNPATTGRKALPRVLEAALTFAWWSLVRHPVKRERARGRMIRHAEILRLRWATRAEGRH